eukprot:1407435-Rhodomonas_salina.1
MSADKDVVKARYCSLPRRYPRTLPTDTTRTLRADKPRTLPADKHRTLPTDTTRTLGLPSGGASAATSEAT